jgi:hypothetical protein
LPVGPLAGWPTSYQLLTCKLANLLTKLTAGSPTVKLVANSLNPKKFLEKVSGFA